jgi:hypothetical protein
MSHTPTPDLQPFAARPTQRQEIKPMSFRLNRALDVAISVLIVFLTVSTGAATAFLHA